MKMGKTGAWGMMCCSTDYDRRALRSWFPHLPDDWRPILADVWEEFDTGRTPKLRVLFERPDGSLTLAECKQNRRTYVLRTSSPAPTLLKEWRADRRLPADGALGAPLSERPSTNNTNQ